MNDSVIGYGLIGCGGFGRFCLGEYQKMETLHCVAVADHDPTLARATAEQFGVQACASAEALLARPDIQIVHLATPPSTHAALATAALEAGKHVLCEKPLALTMDDAEAMVALARARERVLAVNLIMRYNPLCAGVKRLAELRLLGEPLYATLTNAAQDEVLGAGHWFWDPLQSGGIFIEHGVHFFDLFEWWFGAGELLTALQLSRPGTSFVDQVQCSVRYGELTLGTFYHGFHQMRRRDEQHWRIVFETGTLTMGEWVPTSLEIDMHGSEAVADRIRGLFPDGGLEIVARYGANERQAMSRHRPREVDVHARIKATAGYPKMELYGVMLRSLMADQLRAIHHPRSPRLVSEQNGLSSLAYAVAANQMAGAGA
jgi:predicted dehydrogenase